MAGPDDRGRPRARTGLRWTDDELVLETRPRGLHGEAVARLVGGVLVLVISGQWTAHAFVMRGAESALVSLPFWLVGIGVVGAALHAMVKHHRVDLRADAGSIRLFPVGWRRPLRPQTLVASLDHVPQGEADGRGEIQVPVLVLADGEHVFHLMEGLPDAEHRWVMSELNAWLAARRATLGR